MRFWVDLNKARVRVSKGTENQTAERRRREIKDRKK